MVWVGLGVRRNNVTEIHWSRIVAQPAVSWQAESPFQLSSFTRPSVRNPPFKHLKPEPQTVPWAGRSTRSRPAGPASTYGLEVQTLGHFHERLGLVAKRQLGPCITLGGNLDGETRTGKGRLKVTAPPVFRCWSFFCGPIAGDLASFIHSK